MDKAHCPVLQNASEAIQAGKGFITALRKLRKSMRQCANCEAEDNCPIRAEFNAQIEQAITEITEEWGLTG